MTQLLTLGLQRLGGLFNILRRGRGGVRVGFDARNIVGDVLGAECRMLGAAGNLLGGGTLLLDRSRDRGCDLIDLADDTSDRKSVV